MRALLYIVSFTLVVVVAVVSGNAYQTAVTGGHEEEAVDQGQESESLPQLETEEPEDAATMKIMGTPPMMPDFHKGFWDSVKRHESCISCHGNSESAPTLPADHYNNNTVEEGISRDSCIQCHATQNDTKPAFNREQ